MKTLILSIFLLMMYPGKRQVIIFYNADSIALKNKQLAEWNKDADGLKDRDITVETLDINTAKAEVKKWNINTAKPFTIILVGKDGGEKLRSDSVIPNTKLFGTIDAMPMRKSEMKEE